MKFQTHMATSVAGTIALTQATDLTLTPILIAGVIVGSILPDIDEPNSKFGRMTPGVSHGIKLVFKHRGITHTLGASLLVATLLVYFWTQIPIGLAIGISLGYLFHVLGDALSVSGVPLLYPFTEKRFKIPLYTTGGWREKIIFVASLFWMADMLGILKVSTLFG